MRNVLLSSCGSSFVSKKTHKEPAVNKTIADTYLEDEDDVEEEELAQFYKPLADPDDNPADSAIVPSSAKKQNKNLIASPRKDTHRRTDPNPSIKVVTVAQEAVTPLMGSIPPLHMIQFPHVEPPTDWMNASPTDWNLDTPTHSHQESDAFFPPWTITVGNSTDAFDENVPVDVDTNEKWSPEWSIEMAMADDIPFLTTAVCKEAELVPQDKKEEASKTPLDKSLTLGLLAQISGLMDYQEDEGQYYQGTDVNYVEPDVSDSELEKAVLATPSFDSQEEREQKSISTFNSRGSKSHNSSLFHKIVMQKEVVQDIQFDMNVDDCSWSDILDQSYDSDLPKLLQSYSNVNENVHESSMAKTDIPLQHHRNLSSGSKDSKGAQESTRETKLKEDTLTKSHDNKVKGMESEASRTKLSSSFIEESTSLVPSSTVTATVITPSATTTTTTKTTGSTFPWKSNLKPPNTNFQPKVSVVTPTSVASFSPQPSSAPPSNAQPQPFSHLLAKFNEHSTVKKKNSRSSDGMRELSLSPPPLPTSSSSSNFTHKSIQDKPSSTIKSRNDENSSSKVKRTDDSTKAVVDTGPETISTEKSATQNSIDEEVNKPFDELLARYSKTKKKGGSKPGLEQKGTLTPKKFPVKPSASVVNESLTRGKLDNSKTVAKKDSDLSGLSGRETPLTSHLSPGNHKNVASSKQIKDPDWLVKQGSNNAVANLPQTRGNSLRTQKIESGEGRKPSESALNVQLKPNQTPRSKNDTIVNAPWIRPNSPQVFIRNDLLKDSSEKDQNSRSLEETNTGMFEHGDGHNIHADSKDASRVASPIDSTSAGSTTSSKLIYHQSIGAVHGRYTGKSNLSHVSSSTIGLAPISPYQGTQTSVTSKIPSPKSNETVAAVKSTALIQSFETELVEAPDSSRTTTVLKPSSMGSKIISGNRNDKKPSFTTKSNAFPSNSTSFLMPTLKPVSSKPKHPDEKPAIVQESKPNMITAKVFNNMNIIGNRAQSPGPIHNASAFGVTKHTPVDSERKGVVNSPPIDLVVQVDETSVHVSPASNLFQRYPSSTRPKTAQPIATTSPSPNWSRSKTPQPNVSASPSPSWMIPKTPQPSSYSTSSSKKVEILPGKQELRTIQDIDRSSPLTTRPLVSANVNKNSSTMKESTVIVQPSPVISKVDDRLVAPSSVKMNRREERVISEAKQALSHTWATRKHSMALDDSYEKEDISKPVIAASQNFTGNLQKPQPYQVNTASDHSVFSPSAMPAIRVKRTTSVLESVSVSNGPVHTNVNNILSVEPNTTTSARAPASTLLTSRIAMFEQDKKKSESKNVASRRIATNYK